VNVSIDTHDRSGPVLAGAPSAAPVLQTEAYQHQLADAERLEREIVQANLGAGSGAPVVARK
jgi:membrane fusion protein (multidrug efflux system)